MLVGASLLCICLIIMSVLSIVAHFLYGGDYSSLDDRQDNFVFEGQTKREAIAFVCMEYIYVAVFAYTWGNLGWVYPSELYNQGKLQWKGHRKR